MPKHSPTHDQPFEFSEENSSKNHLIKDDLPPLYCGFCLLRLLHCVYSLRLAGPTNHVLISKINIKSAYRRGTMSTELAAKIMTIIGMSLLLCCIPLVGSYFTFLWCVVSETITDLGNDVL